MADDQPNPSQDDAGSDASIGGMSEAELTGMLAQAGELVDQLSAQLGEPDPLPLTPAADPQTEAPSSDTGVEAQLSQLEDLVAETSTEVGDTVGAAVTPTNFEQEEPEPTPPPPQYDEDTGSEFEGLFPEDNFPPPLAPEFIEKALAEPEPAATQWPLEEETTHPETEVAEETNETPPQEVEAPKARPVEESDTIPDFMKEFTDPEPEEPKPADPATPPEVVTRATPMSVQTKPGVVGTGVLYQAVKPAEAAEAVDSVDSGASDETIEHATPKAPNPLVRIARGILISLLQRCKQIGPLKPLLMRGGYWICDKMIFGLEKIDKPISGIGDRIRRVAGWVAVATIGTSVIVFIISLF